MFSRQGFAGMRRAGMGVSVSKTKLSQAMLEILVQLPVGTTDLKDTIVANMGMMGMMTTTRDLNAAWTTIKNKAAKEYSDLFFLDERKVLHWNDGTTKQLDKKISAANFKKLNELADTENCNVNQVVSKLLRNYQKAKAK